MLLDAVDVDESLPEPFELLDEDEDPDEELPDPEPRRLSFR